MSDETAEQMPGKRRSVSLGRLYLDPNNYRFVDHPDYRHVPLERVFDPVVQRRTTGFVLGRHQENVRDLIASIRANGWLDIDPILVETKDKGRYLVVEGNRRVATLKYLERRYEEDAIDLGKLDASTFSKLPVVLYQDASERDHLVMMGLHHISGKRRWPAINRARAMERLLPHFDGDADAVCEALGVSKREFNLSVRTLALVNAYKDSDYGDQLQSDQYNLFREVLKSEPMRAWLGWDHTALAASSQSNLNRLFSWMSREAEPDDGEEDGQDVDIATTSDPVISTGGHVRELAKIIEDSKAVKRLDETRSLQEATLSSDLLVKSEIDGAFKSCEGGIQKLDRRIGELATSELDRVELLIGRLQGMMLARKRQPPATGHRLPWQPFNEITRSQFSSIRIGSYRGIDGLVLDAPGRINLIVGVNNAGKTSLLEAIHLLAHQNDERALLDTIRWRGRVEGEPPPLWLVEQLPRSAHISGSFDQVPDNMTSVEFEVDTEPEPDVEDQTSFLSKLAIESSYERRVRARTSCSSMTVLGGPDFRGSIGCAVQRLRARSQPTIPKRSHVAIRKALRRERSSRSSTSSGNASTPASATSNWPTGTTGFWSFTITSTKRPTSRRSGKACDVCSRLDCSTPESAEAYCSSTNSRTRFTPNSSWSSRDSSRTLRSNSTCRSSCRPTARRRLTHSFSMSTEPTTSWAMRSAAPATASRRDATTVAAFCRFMTPWTSTCEA